MKLASLLRALRDTEPPPDVPDQLLRLPDPTSRVCPNCGRTSHHPEDVRQRYCGACHAFHLAGPVSDRHRMGRQLIASRDQYRLPIDHILVTKEITERARALGACPGSGCGPHDDHDPDVVYSARLVVAQAFCLRCGVPLPTR